VIGIGEINTDVTHLTNRCEVRMSRSSA